MRRTLYVLAVLLVLVAATLWYLTRPGPGPGASRVIATAASPARVATPGSSGAMPDPALTPGEVFTGVASAEICISGYAGRARNVTHDQYVQVYGAYGIPYPQPPGAFELDHLVPLELGGDNANRNLWPEPAAPAPGFHQKDALENALHDLVCSGRMTLGDAQLGIAHDWIGFYHRYVQP